MDIIPDFKNVRPTDRTRLLLQVCERKYRFGELKFFQNIPRFLWLKFYEHMEKRVYLKGDVIFERGAPSAYFFVIRTGKVWFMMNQDEFKTYPFMEVQDWFGEFEMFDETPRKWALMAKNKVVVYLIPRIEFLRMLDSEKIRTGFLTATVDRIEKMEMSERECGRTLRRNGRVKDKIKRVLQKAKESIQMSINVSKSRTKNGKGWHEDMVKIQDEFQTKQIEK